MKSQLIRLAKIFVTICALLPVPGNAATAPAKPAPTIDDLLTSLAKSLPVVSVGGSNQQFTQYLIQIRSAISQGRSNDVVQFLETLRSGPASTSKEASDIIDQLEQMVQAKAAATTAERNAVLDRVIAETAAKFNARAPAAEFDVLIKQLAALPPGSRQYEDPEAQKLELVRSFIVRWQDYLVQIAHDNQIQANNILSELMQTVARLPIVPRSQLVELQAEASKRMSDRVDKITKSLEATIDSAKTAADFDALLAELSKPEAGNNRYATVDALRNFIRSWQDYFSQMEAGNPSVAQATLKALATNNNSESFYPRSKLLARANGKPANAPPADPLVAPAALTIDNLDKFVRQLAARQNIASSPSEDFVNNDVFYEANRLRTAIAQSAGGNLQAIVLLGRTQNISGQTGAYARPLAQIQQDVILKALPVYIAAPATLQPTKEDTPQTYLARVVDTAMKQKDWQLIYRTLNAKQNLGNSSAVSADIIAFGNFFTGLNLEKAGQWASAVHVFRAALRGNIESLPAEEIGLHLAQIKKDHPQEFEAAERLPDYSQSSGQPTINQSGLSPEEAARQNALMRSRMGQPPLGFPAPPR